MSIKSLILLTDNEIEHSTVKSLCVVKTWPACVTFSPYDEIFMNSSSTTLASFLLRFFGSSSLDVGEDRCVYDDDDLKPFELCKGSPLAAPPRQLPKLA